MRLLLALVGAVTVLVVGAAPAGAHGAMTTARVTVTAGASTDVVAEVEVEYDLLMKSAWLRQDAWGATDPAEQLRQLEAHRVDVAAYVADRFQVAYGDSRCTAKPTEAPERTERDGRGYAVIHLGYDCEDEPGRSHALFSALFSDSETFVHSTTTLVHYDLDGTEGTTMLKDEDTHEITPAEHGESRQWASFVVLGGEHLLLGLDHLLFLLVLVLGSRSVRDVVLAASTFTVAHSVTFLLAALGMVSVPTVIVEPVIALSIAVVAVLTLVGRGERRGRWRLPVVLAFGLLHGLGFAGALGLDEVASWDLLGALLAFNIGIELVQLALIAGLFPVVVLLRRVPRGQTVLVGAAALVAVTGTVWFVERLVAGVAPV
ncbi:MAG: HupE/UreJ family protein [Nocardioides sp.]|uniref:HupE/UreJ family protein n=1 Tax=Nocardioides sp. TaxID=35761 RepID=UPI0032650428